ncbi:MAG: hypothetical protein WB662_02005 [Methyloceanibacter sp.]
MFAPDAHWLIKLDNTNQFAAEGAAIASTTWDERIERDVTGHV